MDNTAHARSNAGVVSRSFRPIFNELYRDNHRLNKSGTVNSRGVRESTREFIVVRKAKRICHLECLGARVTNVALPYELRNAASACVNRSYCESRNPARSTTTVPMRYQLTSRHFPWTRSRIVNAANPASIACVRPNVHAVTRTISATDTISTQV